MSVISQGAGQLPFAGGNAGQAGARPQLLLRPSAKHKEDFDVTKCGGRCMDPPRALQTKYQRLDTLTLGLKQRNEVPGAVTRAVQPQRPLAAEELVPRCSLEL